MRENLHFRVFLSSTFDDMLEERNALQARVFPRLDRLCRRFGGRFQAIDLRWGVTAEAAASQQSVEICLREIERCREVSPRPNFVILLGDRYGWEPLPPDIPAHEFERIRDRLEDPTDRELLEFWYWLDENAVPAQWVLQQWTGRVADADSWRDIEGRLRALLRRAVALVDLTPESRRRYFTSITELEVDHAGLSAPDAREHMYAFFRGVSGGLQAATSPGTTALFDRRADGSVDVEKWRRLQELKRRVHKALPGNVHEFEVEPGANHLGAVLRRLCAAVYLRLSSAIRTEIGTRVQLSPLTIEIQAHAAARLKNTRHFVGRESELRTIQEFVHGSPGGTLVVIAASGGGKTALLAEAARRLGEDDAAGVTLVRFIGATPTSASQSALLKSVSIELSRQCGTRRRDLPADAHEMLEALRDHLEQAAAKKHVCLLLDGADRIPDTVTQNVALFLTVAPVSRVCLIISCAPDSSLADRLMEQDSVIALALPPLSTAEADELVRKRMAHWGRTMTSEQRGVILQRFATHGNPLYLTLALEESRRWPSWRRAGTEDLPTDSPGMVRRFLDQLSSPLEHGSEMVSAFLGYLDAARNGLAEDEALELLSRDDEVMNDLWRRNPRSPRVGRMPQAVWLRLYYDLEPFLVVRPADGDLLLAVFHILFASVAREWLGRDKGQRRHEILADYFEQRAHWSTDDPSPPPDLRVLSELPYQLTHCGNRPDRIVNVLTDVRFLVAALRARGTAEILADLNRASSALRQDSTPHLDRAVEALGFVSATLQKWGQALEEDPTELPGHLLERIRADGAPSAEGIRERIQNLKTGSWLRPVKGSAATDPADDLVALVTTAPEKIVRFALTRDGVRLILQVGDGAVRVFEIRQGRYLARMRTRSRITALGVSGSGEHVAVADDDRCISLWDTSEGRLLSRSSDLRHRVSALAIDDQARLAWLAYEDGPIEVWDLTKRERIREFSGDRGGRSIRVGKTGEYEETGVGGQGIRQIAVADDGRTALTTARGRRIIKRSGLERRPNGELAQFYEEGSEHVDDVRVWNLDGATEGFRLATLQPEVSALVVSSDGGLVAYASGESIHVWMTRPPANRATLQGQRGRFTSLHFSPDGSRLLSASAAGATTWWDLSAQLAFDSSVGADLPADAVDGAGRVIASRLGQQRLVIRDTDRLHRLTRLGMHAGPATVVAMTPDGRWGVSSGQDGEIVTWDLIGKTRARRFAGLDRGCLDLRISDDGRVVAAGPAILAGSSEGAFLWWDLSSEAEPALVLTGQARSCRLAMSADGDRVFTVTEGTSQEWIRRLDGVLEQGEHVDTAQRQRLSTPTVCASDGSWIVLQTTEERKYAAFDGYWGFDDIWKGFAIWRPAAGNRLEDMPFFTGAMGYTRLRRLAVTPDGKWAVTVAEVGNLGEPLPLVKHFELALWGLDLAAAVDACPKPIAQVREDQHTQQHIRGGPGSSSGHEPYGPLALSADGRYLVMAVGHRILVYDLPKLTVRWAAESFSSVVEDVSVDRGGTRILVGLHDGSVCLLSPQPNRVWDRPSTGSNSVRSLEVAPDGRSLLSTSVDNLRREWRVSESGLEECARAATDREEVRTQQAARLSRPAPVSGRANATALLAQFPAQVLVSSGRAWTEIASKALGITAASTASRDGALLLLGSSDGRVHLFNGGNRRVLRSANGHGGATTGIVLESSFRRALSYAQDGSLCLWDVHRHECLRRLPGHRAPVVDAAIAARRAVAVSVSEDGRAALWDLEGGLAIGTWHILGKPTACTITPEGRWILLGDDVGRIIALEVVGSQNLGTLF